MTRRAFLLVRIIRGARWASWGSALQKTNVQFWTTYFQFYKILHVDFGFDYFSHNKLDEPDLNLVSILDFYYFRSRKSMLQASLEYDENDVPK